MLLNYGFVLASHAVSLYRELVAWMIKDIPRDPLGSFGSGSDVAKTMRLWHVQHQDVGVWLRRCVIADRREGTRQLNCQLSRPVIIQPGCGRSETSKSVFET